MKPKIVHARDKKVMDQLMGYSLFGKSNVVLITTETLDENGNPLEFDDVEDIQVFYSQETWDKAIELSKLE